MVKLVSTGHMTILGQAIWDGNLYYKYHNLNCLLWETCVSSVSMYLIKPRKTLDSQTKKYMETHKKKKTVTRKRSSSCRGSEQQQMQTQNCQHTLHLISQTTTRCNLLDSQYSSDAVVLSWGNFWSGGILWPCVLECAHIWFRQKMSWRKWHFCVHTSPLIGALAITYHARCTKEDE